MRHVSREGPALACVLLLVASAAACSSSPSREPWRGSSEGGVAGSSSGSSGSSGSSSTSSSGGWGGSSASSSSGSGSNSSGSNSSGSSTSGSSSGSSSSGSSSGGGDPYAAARQACVDYINKLRATLGRPPYARWTANEACTDTQAKADGASGTAHSAFGQCNESGQCECPGWSSVSDIIPGCLDAMWSEGPGGGHYDIMSSTQYTMVSCGFAPAADGSMWGTQDYQ